MCLWRQPHLRQAVQACPCLASFASLAGFVGWRNAWPGCGTWARWAVIGSQVSIMLRGLCKCAAHRPGPLLGLGRCLSHGHAGHAGQLRCLLRAPAPLMRWPARQVVKLQGKGAPPKEMEPFEMPQASVRPAV